MLVPIIQLSDLYFYIFQNDPRDNSGYSVTVQRYYIVTDYIPHTVPSLPISYSFILQLYEYHLFIYSFWRCWVSAAPRGIRLAVEGRGYSVVVGCFSYAGFSCGALFLGRHLNVYVDFNKCFFILIHKVL